MNFYTKSNGKLLLTGEYLVLLGAKALAFPVKYGQDLKVSSNNAEQGELLWTAKELGETWFETKLSLTSLEIISTSSKEKANFLSELLKSARALNPSFLKPSIGLRVETNTDFPIIWGLGTSSTLINNIATWATIDPFKLHALVSEGSGYDIACAGANKPIVYQTLLGGNRKVEVVNFNKPFLDKLHFVFSGKKMRTEKHISKFVSKEVAYSKEIRQIDSITEQILETAELTDFINFVLEHEKIISEVLGQKTIQQKEFREFKGVVKSLGAWGGDFLLVASDENNKYVQDYFEQFDLSVIIPFRNMVL